MKTLLASLALLASVVTAQADGSADDVVQNLYPLKVLDASWDGNQFYLVVLDNGQDRTGLANTVCQIIEARDTGKSFAVVRVMDAGSEYRVLGKAMCDI